ncbi:MAG: ComEC/Rec2 family competence protein, partial [Hyphomicrobiales bacterium]
FDQIGAYGFTLSRPDILDRNEAGARSWGAGVFMWIGGIRAAVAERVMEAAGKKGGPVAAALLTGLRGNIPKSDLSAIRDAGLAHLLAISGLHMALMSGAAFWIVRFLIASIPWLALRVVGKKWAAGVGIFTGLVYFLLAGGSVATERAFIMVAVALVAVLVDRPAISLRNVALAALIVLLMRPENLVEAGFQMSFAAVVALTAFYERVKYPGRGDTGNISGARSTNPGSMIVKILLGTVLTTLIASLATGPLAAFNFNRVAVFGLAANVLAVPLVGFAVMPLGLLALILMPFGLDGPALALMGMGTAALVDISRTVSGWPGAAILVPSPPAMVIPVLVSGGLWLCLWRRNWRFWGLVPMGLAFWLAAQNQTPDIYVDEQGRRIAIKTTGGQLILSKDRGARYAASQWLRRMADPRDVKTATSAGGDSDALTCDPRGCIADFVDTDGRNYRLAYIRHPAAIAEECRQADIVIARIPLFDRCVGPAIVIDRFDLSRSGASTISFGPPGPQVTTVMAEIGWRPWARNP